MTSIKIDPVTTSEQKSWPKSPLVSLERPFIDARGSIQPLVDCLMKSAVLIESKAGSLRANHYHKTDWHYCYVISGCINYYHRKQGSKIKPELLIVDKEKMVFTPPLIEHCMKFPVDTIFLTLSRNPRDQDTYESDVVRTNLIDSSNSISWTPDE